MKRRFVYNPETKQMDEVSLDYHQPSEAPMIMPDIPDFVSPIDGSVVHGRKSLAAHNKKHGVTNTADYTKQWERQAAERARVYTDGSNDKVERRKQINDVITALQKRRR